MNSHKMSKRIVLLGGCIDVSNYVVIIKNSPLSFTLFSWSAFNGVIYPLGGSTEMVLLAEATFNNINMFTTINTHIYLMLPSKTGMRPI